MRRAYWVAGWGIVLLGAVHIVAATSIFDGVTAHALWFVSGGIAMLFLGAFNLLNHAYGASAPGLRRVAVAANVVMTVFGVIAGTVTKASWAELITIIGLLGGATILSLSASAATARPRGVY